MKKLWMIGLLPLLLLGCDGSGSGDSFAPSQQTTSVVIQTLSLPRAEVSAGYSEQLAGTTTAGSGPLNWTLTPASAALPSGLSLTTAGLITGTPGQAGLYTLEVEARNTLGEKATSRLDLVVYENLFFSYAPDVYDAPSNNDYASATQLGTLGMNAPIIEPGPLTVTANPAGADVDLYAFTTPYRGEITVEVFFANSVGKLITGLHADHNGVIEMKQPGVPATGGDDNLIVLEDAAAGTWFLKVEAQYKNVTWYANAYAFRITFNELTIATELVEIDTAITPAPVQLDATNADIPVTTGVWSLLAGTLPTGLTLGTDGQISGAPSQLGLARLTVAVDVGGLAASREIAVRVYDSGSGDYWQRFGEHRYYNPGIANGDGAHHEHYCEATVVAPHPDYSGEGAIYVIGGREVDTVANVYVFHTAHQAVANRNYKLEDIGRPLSSERQYVGAAYLQHSYGGYIYVVGGELYSNTAPSSGDYTCVVERMQVADGGGVALASPGTWETLAELPTDKAGRQIEGWAEFGLAVSDDAQDVNDRLYVVGGRIRVEDAVGSNYYQYEYNEGVVMFEAPTTSTGNGVWFEKADATPYTPRRMPMVGLIDGRIYIAGGRAAAGTADYIEMYQPDPAGTNAALAVLGAGNYPTLAEPVWYGAATVHNGALYVLNGWKLQGYSPVATSRLQRFTPNASGTAGAMSQLTTPDNGSGYHSAVFHDGKLWFITGRDSLVPTPRYSLRYEP